MRRFKTLLSLSVVGLGLALFCPHVAAQTSSSPENPRSTGGFRIAGKVVNGLTDAPLARARVTVVDTKNQEKTLSTITAEGGSFEFLALPAGKYALNGARRGFISAAYDEHERFSTAIVTGAGLDTEHLVLRLAPAAALGGTVLDEFGEPVRHATVSLYRQDREEGVKHIYKVRTDITDDQGSYEFSPLQMGIYFVSATATPWYAVHRVSFSPDQAGTKPAADRSLDVAYPEVYYKDVTEPGAALPISLRGGEHLEADLHLNPVPALHLTWASPEQFVSPPAIERPAFGETDSVPVSWERVSPGLFESGGVPPGTYAVRIPATSPEGPTVDFNLDLREDGQEIDASKGEPESSLKASVRMVGGEKPPPELALGLRDIKLKSVIFDKVDSKGEVKFAVAPGRYQIVVAGPRRAYSVVGSSSEGAETAGDRIKVPVGRSLAVSLLVAGSTATVEGFAERNGQPVAGAMVLLVPKDAESNRTLFRRDQSDLDGSFSLLNVMPGSYSIIAIANGWDLDWASPAVIRAYARHATTITVRDSQGPIHLPKTVEVETR
jgi:hypothetical protein